MEPVEPVHVEGDKWIVRSASLNGYSQTRWKRGTAR